MAFRMLIVIAIGLTFQACGFVVNTNNPSIGPINQPQSYNRTGPRCIKCEWPVGQHYFAHPSDCTKFIQCSPQGPVEQDCALATRFDFSLPATICNHIPLTPCVTGNYDTVDGYCESPIINPPKKVICTGFSNPPQCRRVSCGVPEQPVGFGNDFQFRGNITYNCRNVYNLQGDAILTCQASGAHRLRCFSMWCGELELPTNSIVPGKDFQYDGIVTHTCTRFQRLVVSCRPTCTNTKPYCRLTCLTPSPVRLTSHVRSQRCKKGFVPSRSRNKCVKIFSGK
ncbi:unnamed protein product [Meganyctiphanes norvegica]|uniref:Chitin-binding type-2 domain-containing protein n=1 Tax=Meganyctiphanes norvegica TaxID=48144 RepID=A0AAV2QK97_MEGNR